MMILLYHHQFHHQYTDGDIRDETTSYAGNNNINNNSYVHIWSTTSSHGETNISDYCTSAYHNNYTSVGYNTEDIALSYTTTSYYNYYYENSSSYDNYAFLNYPQDDENQTYFHL